MPVALPDQRTPAIRISPAKPVPADAANTPAPTPLASVTIAPTPPAVAAAVEPASHKPVHAAPIAPADAPPAFSSPDTFVPAPLGDVRGGALASAAVTSANAPATPTQDIAALVDRITEARAAAAPHTIRAALMHEDFGSVSLNLRSEASHIHVTLGSADPGFAPAVQAAAAASLAGNGAGDGDNARREEPAPQPSTPSPDTATRNDASQQQPSRDRAQTAERQSPRDPLSRRSQPGSDRSGDPATPQRRSGIYA
jgi:hypothetical protein